MDDVTRARSHRRRRGLAGLPALPPVAAAGMAAIFATPRCVRRWRDDAAVQGARRPQPGSDKSSAGVARTLSSHAVEADPLVAKVRDHFDLAAEGLDILP